MAFCCSPVQSLFIQPRLKGRGGIFFFQVLLACWLTVPSVWTREKLQLYKYSWRWVEGLFTRVNYRPPGWKWTLLFHVLLGEFGVCHLSTVGKKNKRSVIGCQARSIIDLTGCCSVWRVETEPPDVGCHPSSTNSFIFLEIIWTSFCTSKFSNSWLDHVSLKWFFYLYFVIWPMAETH